MSVPVILYDAQKAAMAYHAYVTILNAEIADPDLRWNAAWTILKQEAYANFYCAFDVEGAR